MSTTLEKPPLEGAVAQNVRKGVLMFLCGEFTLSFDHGFLKTHRQEYLMFVELVRALKQRKPSTHGFAWTIAVAPDAVKQLTQFIAWGITPTKDAREKLSAELKKSAAVNALAQSATEEAIDLHIPGNPELEKSLKNYQKSGVKFMATMERAYNGDDMGTGKSLQALAAIELKQAYPALIICPVKLKQNWLHECRKWLPKRSASLLANDFAEITILGYSEIHKLVHYKLASPKAKVRKAAAHEIGTRKFFFPDFVRPKSVTCDEGHWIKHGDSIRCMAATAIAQLSEAPVRFVLSGTPIENGRPAELIAPLTFLDVMTKMGGWHHYATRYCGGKRTKFGFDLTGATNTLELHSLLSRTVLIRRRKKDVLKELPDKIEAVYEAELSNEVEYRRIEKDIVAWMMAEAGGLVGQTRMDAKHLIKLNALRQCAGIGKVNWIIDWIDTFLEGGEKFVIYAHHKAVLDALVRGLAQWHPATVLGGCDDVQREQDKFMKDERCRLFIGSTLAAGFGLTLTAASHIGIAELMWTHSKHQQVVDRVHRIGQKDCVNAYYFLAPNTIDDDLWELVSDKAKITASTADGEELTQSALLKNLVRKFLTN